MSRLILRRSRIRPVVFWTFLCRTNQQPRPAKYLKPLCTPNHHKLSTHTKIHLSLYEQLTHLATLKHLIAPQYQSPHPINHSQPATNKKALKRCSSTHTVYTHTHTHKGSEPTTTSKRKYLSSASPAIFLSLSWLACAGCPQPRALCLGPRIPRGCCCQPPLLRFWRAKKTMPLSAMLSYRAVRAASSIRNARVIALCVYVCIRMRERAWIIEFSARFCADVYCMRGLCADSER